MSIPAFGDPAPVDAIDFPSTGQTCARAWGSYYRNGKYYQILATTSNFFSNSISAYSSLDGSTWTKLDEIHQPSGTQGGPGSYWDGASAAVGIVYYSFTDAVTRYQEFDLDAETWGAPSVDGPASLHPLGLWKRSDATFLMLLSDAGDASYLSAVTWDGASWGTPFDVAANMRALTDYDMAATALRGPTAVLDSTDRLHVFWGNTESGVSPPAGWDNRYFYQAIESDFSLGQFTDFGTSDLADTSDYPHIPGTPSAVPVVIDDNVIWGVYRNQITGVAAAQFAALYIGTPLSAPVFTSTDPIDSAGAAIASPAAILGDYPTVQYINNILYATFVRATLAGVPSQIVVAFNSGFDYTTAWDSQLIYDYQVTPLDPNPGTSYLILSPILSQAPVSFNGFGFGVQTTGVEEPFPLPAFWFTQNFKPPCILLTIDAIDPATSVEARYFMDPQGAGLYLPVLIDTASDGQGTGGGSTAGTYGQIIARDSGLYVLTWSQPDKVANVLKSIDSGVTWAKVDAAHSPAANFSGAHCYDGSRIVYCYQIDNLALGPKRFQNFDLGTEKWGPVYGDTSQPDIYTPMFIYKRPSGSILVVTSTRTIFNSSIVDSGMLAVSFSGGAWGTPFDPATGWTALPHYKGTNTGVQFVSNYMDDSGIVGMFAKTSSFNNSPVIWDNRIFYQQIMPDDSLGAFFDFPGQDVFPQDLMSVAGPPMGTPLLVVSQNSIVLPVTRTQPVNTSSAYQSLYVGFPISNPVWAEIPGTSGIDAAVVGLNDFSLYPEVPAGGCFDGTTMFFVWVTFDGTGSVALARLRCAFSTSLTDFAAGWRNATLYDMTVDGPPGFYSPGSQELSLPSVVFCLGVVTDMIPNRVYIPRWVGIN